MPGMCADVHVQPLIDPLLPPPPTYTGPLSVCCTEGISEGNPVSRFVSQQPHSDEKSLCPLCHVLPGEGCRTVYDGE